MGWGRGRGAILEVGAGLERYDLLANMVRACTAMSRAND